MGMATSIRLRGRCLENVRKYLFASVAGVVVLHTPFEPARAGVTFSPGSACFLAGDTITCTGDISPGIDIEISPPDTVSTLIVSSLTPINASSLSGIKFLSEGVIVISSDAVIVSQAAIGIDANSIGNPNGGDVTVSQTGNITAQLAGIFATSTVDIHSLSSTDTAGNVTVTQTGNITSLADRGIYVWSTAVHGIAGNVSVTQSGNISAFTDGISATSQGSSNLVGGDVSVTQTGNIFAQANGIYVVSSAGGDNGTAGDVTITQIGDITTGGNGINASSAGGKDGTAGQVTVTQRGNISTQNTNAFAITAYSAIMGGHAGTADDVSVTQTGNITTQGADAYGIQAYASTTDGDTGRVTVVQAGIITTHGDGAYAIEAYTTTGNGNADDVTVSQTGVIATNGDGAYAIDAYSRSFNGAAGNVVVTQSGDITTTGTNSFGVNASSLAGVDGSDVTVTRAGNLTTQGDGAYGIFASSRGETAGGDVTVLQTGIISTLGDNAYGIQAEATTAHGTAGSATVTLIGDIVTTGADSTGIRATSGGGAVGGVVTVTATGNITTQGHDAYGISASSSGETAGGAVTVSLAGNITTQDDGAYGIFATSSVLDPGIGSYTAGDVTVTQTGNISLGGGHGIFAWSSTRSGTAGNVTVIQNGTITTSGSNLGIRAFSESEETAGRVTVTQNGDISADGGGILAVSTASGHTGTAGGVTVTQIGTISTLSDGIHAASAGGDNGTAGHVTVTQSGEIAAGGYGIFARIYGQAGTGSIGLMLTDSTIVGGGASNAGVRIEGLTGASGTLNSYGVTTISAASGTAVSATDGDDTINNFGVLTTVGTVDLGAGANFINNMAGAIYNSGTTINLGAGNLFTNAGALSPGGSDIIATTGITGNFVQTSSGQLLTDIDLGAGTSDLTTISGTASLAGHVRVRSTDFALGEQQVTFFSAAGGTANNGLDLISSPALHTSLVFPNANDVALTAYVDFLPTGLGDLNHNQTDLANYLNGAAAAHSPGLTPLFLGLINGPSNITEYRSALNQLLPAVFLNSETTSAQSSADFSNDLFSCNVAGSGTAFIRQNECVWVRPKARKFEYEGTSQNIGFDDRAAGLSAGAQVRLAPDWFATAAIGYERGHTETAAGAESKSDHYQVGFGLKYQTGPWFLAGAVSGGIAQFETTRTIAFPDFSRVSAQSDPDITFATAQLRAAYLSDFGSWYAKPLVDLQVTYLDRDAVTETGGGPANLWVSGAADTSFSISPAIEFGTEYAIGSGASMKPFLKTGFTYLGDADRRLTAGFVEAAPGVPAFSIDFSPDDLYANLEAGVQIFEQDGSTLSFGYKDMISDHARQNGIFAKGTLKF